MKKTCWNSEIQQFLKHVFDDMNFMLFAFIPIHNTLGLLKLCYAHIKYGEKQVNKGSMSLQPLS